MPNTAIPIRLRRVPDRIISPIVINLDEYASADAGVAIGRINAKLLGRITAMAASDGPIPYVSHMLSVGGSKTAITAELLIKVVTTVDNTATTNKNMGAV